MVALMDPGEDPEDTLHTHRSREKTFIFDIVFDLHTSQTARCPTLVGVCICLSSFRLSAARCVLATPQHLVEGVISGYNATVFAHGPSGASKTHTMLRMDAGPGIYLQMLTDLFQAVEETRESTDCSVSMSCLEIYNEVIWDLLNPSSGFLDLREDSRGSIQIAGITEVSTSNTQELRTTQLLTKGNWQRTQESTATSKMSSRSHAVLQVTVHQRSHGTDMTEEVHIGRLSMVDLAGLELAPQTQNRGKRMKEGAPINRSLLALGNCINALSEKGDSQAQYVNFWDANSRVPQDALGGNSRMVMIAHISPASTHFEESRTTLLYAYRARNIKRRVKRNLLNVSCHIAQYADIISDLGRQIKHPKAKVEKQEKEKRSIPAAGMLKLCPIITITIITVIIVITVTTVTTVTTIITVITVITVTTVTTVTTIIIVITVTTVTTITTVITIITVITVTTVTTVTTIITVIIVTTVTTVITVIIVTTVTTITITITRIIIIIMFL
ncbi:kinesin-like protein KIF19 [Eschrichtius robustus]|uniref:kinesin-like protein KIF19 n=1 Tax=Eschrichtius robustus TaxID=9764 RepID=UPI0035BFDF59